MPHSPTPVAYTRPMRHVPWPERCVRPSMPPCEAAHDTACSGARGTSPPLVSMAAAHARPAIPRASTSAANAVQPNEPLAMRTQAMPATCGRSGRPRLECVLSSCYRPVWREFSFRKSGRF